MSHRTRTNVLRRRWRRRLRPSLSPMARKPRRYLADGTYHVTGRGNRGQAIFSDDGDRRFFRALLDRVTRESRWHLHAYCLLNTHYHLLVETSVHDLSAGMHRLNGMYAQCFNGRHSLSGHLFQDRFYAGLIEADGHLLEVTRYLALNPMRAGLCSAPDRWPWSSYPGLVGVAPLDPFVSDGRVLRLFSEDRKTAQRLIRRFVADTNGRPQ
jgi:putative transposase